MTGTNMTVQLLGARDVLSPLALSSRRGDGIGNFVDEDSRVRRDVEVNSRETDDELVLLEKAGPRERIFFDPPATRAAIVTCGGLCPGLNSVISSAVRQLNNYGVKEILGIRHGYRGLNPDFNLQPVLLNEEEIEGIHRRGGTILGTSRGPQNQRVVVDSLVERGINVLLCIGGDGTQRGAHAIAEEALARELSIAVVGIPKTIDNDIGCISRSFGFATAVDEARHVLDGCHEEALSVPNGVGIVKLMGRQSGFIAAHAALASQVVDFVLVPEVRFTLDGPGGLLELLKARLESKGHVLIVVAEGAGQDVIAGMGDAADASGNILFGDIGVFLKQRIASFFRDLGMPIGMKYIDPSYIIRSVAPNCEDSLLCDQLARHAVHAAMGGRTDALVGPWKETFIQIPIEAATKERKVIDPESDLWVSVHETTGQPLLFL
ncbi:MAG: ATP-dependent 6-phosphofructokinase [Verrucomicrobia bacterium]|nr:ATP-dependent 6-phosphofructokinase [Verrucomicrobiota bacterium]